MSKKIVAHITESEVREDKEGSEISNVIYGEDHVEGKSFKEVKEKLLERGIKFPRRYVEESGIYQDDKKGQSHRTGFIIRGKDKYLGTFCQPRGIFFKAAKQE